ncbi:MAG: lipase [Spirochaetes bacterium]|nr:lipase [Spirochaetota bacterium]
MSLIHQNLEFHNVAALEDSPGLPGKILPRYPAATRRFLSERGRFVSMESTGCEIRFVTAAPNVRLFLSHLEADQEATVYRGEFLVGRYAVPMGKVTCLHLAPPERFDWVRPELLRGAFDAAVWRVCFNRATAVFHGIDAFGHEVRPPDPSEKPGKRWLAYGSSITHGNLLSYIFHTGRILGLDVSNKGLSGACQIEAAAADYLADGVAYEVATLELGVNMRDGQFTPQEFEKRATYLVERLIGKNPQTPHFLITIFPNFDDFRPAGKETTGTQNDAAFDEAIRRIHAKIRHPLLHLIEGSQVLVHPGGLSNDLIHPGEFGHAQMGANLARLMAAHLAPH